MYKLPLEDISWQTVFGHSAWKQKEKVTQTSCEGSPLGPARCVGFDLIQITPAPRLQTSHEVSSVSQESWQKTNHIGWVSIQRASVVKANSQPLGYEASGEQSAWEILLPRSFFDPTHLPHLQYTSTIQSVVRDGRSIKHYYTQRPFSLDFPAFYRTNIRFHTSIISVTNL